MNIYEKLQNVRVDLAAEGIRKGGNNTYSNYDYFELADFLPQLNQLCKKHKLGHSTTFSDDCKMVVLTVTDIEKPDATIDFKIPASSAQLKASHPVQNLGAVLTYSRRYLYMMAFDIVQSDVLEATTGKGDAKPTFTLDINAKPMDELTRLWKFVNWDLSTINDYVNARATKMGKETADDEVVSNVLFDNLEYLNAESKKEGSAYYQMIFNEGVPF